FGPCPDLPLTPNAYALLGLTAVVAMLVSALTFAILKFAFAARKARQSAGNRREAALLATALEHAVSTLKAQERATAARAAASEHLSSEIFASLTAGLLVVGLNGDVKILNPAGRRMLHLPEHDSHDDYRRLLGQPALSGLIDECLASRVPVLRRKVPLSEPKG